MKKIIILFSIVLFSATTTFAQWDVYVEWDASSSNCYCDASIGSKFVVYLRITDVANNVTLPSWSVFADIDETDYTFDVEDAVKGHCDELNLTYAPNYTIYAYVGFWCADTTPPELICSDSGTKSNVSCIDFNTETQEITDLELQ